MSGQSVSTGRRIQRCLVAVAVLAVMGCGASQGPSPASPAASPTSATLTPAAPTAVVPASPDAGRLLGAVDLDQPLAVGSYRVGAPFDAPFSIGLPTEWTLKSLSDSDVEFLNTHVKSRKWCGMDRDRSGRYGVRRPLSRWTDHAASPVDR